MSESKSEPRRVKVVDRRKFTAEGEPRAERAATHGEPASTSPEPRPPQGRPPEPAEPRRAATAGARRDEGPAPPAEVPRTAGVATAQTSQDFLELVAMLAQNAEFLLLGADDIPARPDEARRVIDWLAALETKTTGNLSKDEQKVLSDIVFQLRAAYVQRSG